MEQTSELSTRDIVLIGGSAGSIEALLQILRAIPADYPASVFVVVHTSAQGPALLPRVLARAAGLPAIHPAHGAPMLPGHIYVAPPDHHLTLGAEGVIHVRRGARENGHRPAIDTLFRTAAAEGYGPRAVAVVLSGYLDDGSAGLFAVRRRGGLGIVQDPNDALAGEMPVHALQYAGADFILPASMIGTKLVELAARPAKVVTMNKQERFRAAKRSEGHENEISPNEFVAYVDEGEGTPSPFSCPDCHGVLWEIKEGGSVRYRCRTGHGYSEATVNEEMSRAAESALWAAMRALEEKASMARRTADAANGSLQWKNRLDEQAQTFAAHAALIRKMILGEPVSPPAAPAATTEPLDRDQAV